MGNYGLISTIMDKYAYAYWLIGQLWHIVSKYDYVYPNIITYDTV